MNLLSFTDKGIYCARHSLSRGSDVPSLSFSFPPAHFCDGSFSSARPFCAVSHPHILCDIRHLGGLGRMAEPVQTGTSEVVAKAMARARIRSTLSAVRNRSPRPQPRHLSTSRERPQIGACRTRVRREWRGFWSP